MSLDFLTPETLALIMFANDHCRADFWLSRRPHPWWYGFVVRPF